MLPLCQKYLSDDLKKIINSKDNQQINTESNSDMDHYENNNANNYKIKRISHNDDDDDFNNDKQLQELYIKLLKVIRDDIALGNNEIYKKNKNDFIEINNAFIGNIGDLQETYKQMPGWLRSKFRIKFLDDLTIRGKCVIQKNDNQILFCELNKGSSGNKIRDNISRIQKIINDYSLYELPASVKISTEKIWLMSILSFFYYGLNLKFFADLFRLDMHKEDFTILIPLPIVMFEVIGFACCPFALPFIHLFSVIFGLVFLIFNLSIYEGKFISSEDINSYNKKLNNLSEFATNNFTKDKINLLTSSMSSSQDYDKIIDEYEDQCRKNHISSGYHESGSCDCNCDCDCPSAEECLCGCLNACAQDPHCCEYVGLCCLMLVCPLCIPCIAGGRQL